MLLNRGRIAVVIAVGALAGGCSEARSSFGTDQAAVDACVEMLGKQGLLPEERVTRSLNVTMDADGWEVRYDVEDAASGSVSLLDCSVLRDASLPSEVGAVTVRRR